MVSAPGPVIDLHGHLFPDAYLRMLAAQPAGSPVRAVPRGEDFVVEVHGRPFVTAGRRFRDESLRVAELDAAGIDVQLLALSPPMVHWASAAEAARLCRAVNHGLLAAAARHPGRLMACATLPLADPQHAVRELETAHREGARAVSLPTHVQGMNLDDALLDPVYEAMCDLGMCGIVHPVSPRVDPSLKEFDLDVIAGFVTETLYAVLRVVLGGVTTRHPTLRLCWSHLGGTLPMVVDRLAVLSADATFLPRLNAVGAGDDLRAALRSFWWDTVCYSPSTLSFAADVLGADRLVLGTDCPFFHEPISAQLERIDAALPVERRAAVLSTNAYDLLGEHAPRQADLSTSPAT